MRRVLVVGLGFGLLLALMLPAVAGADPINKNTYYITLDCGGGRTVDAVLVGSTSSFHVTDTSSNFVWRSLTYIDPNSGQPVTISDGSNGVGHKNLVTCTYTAGLYFTVVGSFTPNG